MQLFMLQRMLSKTLSTKEYWGTNMNDSRRQNDVTTTSQRRHSASKHRSTKQQMSNWQINQRMTFISNLIILLFSANRAPQTRQLRANIIRAVSIFEHDMSQYCRGKYWHTIRTHHINHSVCDLSNEWRWKLFQVKTISRIFRARGQIPSTPSHLFTIHFVFFWYKIFSRVFRRINITLQVFAQALTSITN